MARKKIWKLEVRVVACVLIWPGFSFPTLPKYFVARHQIVGQRCITGNKKGIFKNIQLYLSLPFQLQINSLIFSLCCCCCSRILEKVRLRIYSRQLFASERNGILAAGCARKKFLLQKHVFSFYRNSVKHYFFQDNNEFRTLEWNVEKVERHWLSTKQIRFVVRSWMGECFWYQSLTVGCLYRTAETSAGYNYCLLKIVLILAIYLHLGKYI